MSSKDRLGPKDIVFPVVGPSGAGKSMFINVAAAGGREITPLGHGSTGPATKQPLPIVFNADPVHPKLQGYRLFLLDTPGFNATETKDADTFNRIAKWLEAPRADGARVGGVIYVHNISEKRSSCKTPLSRFHGPATMPKTALVTTNWPLQHDDVLVRREDEMKETCWKAFIDGGLRVFQFHQTAADACNIINYLLDHMDEVDVPFAVAQVDEGSDSGIFEKTEKFLKSIFLRIFAFR